ncbi:MAG: hypothetical protein KME26_19950 [Oscillatoria princeps RMCB-10]|nr:hypothetical protein [Oscillatoria princeps RMCB-10]
MTHIKCRWGERGEGYTGKVCKVRHTGWKLEDRQPADWEEGARVGWGRVY